MEALARINASLSKASENKFSNPYAEFCWPEFIDLGNWFYTPELMPLYQTTGYANLADETKKHLSFWECINFFSLNIHGEKALLQGVIARLYRDWPAHVSEYLHHFADEENKHMSLFGRFCMNYGNKIYPNRKLSFSQKQSQAVEDFLFFAKIVIFEEIVDQCNLIMAHDTRLHPLLRQINQYHHLDETRHLHFGRNISKELYKTCLEQMTNESEIHDISNYLVDYKESVLREYYNLDIYKDANIELEYEEFESIYSSAAEQSRRAELSKRCDSFLMDLGMDRK